MKVQQSGEKKGLLIGVIALIAIAIIVAAIAVIIVMTKGAPDKESLENAPVNASNGQVNSEILARGYVQDEEEAKQVVSDMKDKVAEGMFECLMTTQWTFDDGTSESPNAYVANAESNRYTFYFDVYLEDEVLYSSPLIPVGSSIRGVTLNRDVDAGEYQMKVLYTLVDENLEEVSSVGFMITATIWK